MAFKKQVSPAHWVVRHQVGQLARLSLMLEQAAMLELLPARVVQHYRERFHQRFEALKQQVWMPVLNQSGAEAIPASLRAVSEEASFLKERRELANTIRPAFDPIRLWSLTQCLPWQPPAPTFQVAYKEDHSKAIFRVEALPTNGVFKLNLPVESWFHPLSWFNLLVDELATTPRLQRGFSGDEALSQSDALLEVGGLPLLVGQLEALPLSQWEQRWMRPDGLASQLPASEAGLTNETIEALVSQASQGLLFGAAPRPVMALDFEKTPLKDQLAAVIDTPLSARQIATVSAAWWVDQAMALPEKLANPDWSLADATQQERHWLHLTLKSWETTQLHQRLQVAAPVDCPSFPVLSEAVVG